MGQVVVGVIIGGIVQLLWMDLSPIGVGIPYDATAVTLLAVYWASLPGHSALSQVTLSLVMAVPLGFLVRWIDQLARRMNTFFMHQVEQVPDSSLPFALWAGIVAGILWSWVRYTVLYVIVFGVGQYVW